MSAGAEDSEEGENLSEDSEDDLVNYFDCNDSDSDVSDKEEGGVDPSHSMSGVSISSLESSGPPPDPTNNDAGRCFSTTG
jgi:hypothetical protein